MNGGVQERGCPTPETHCKSHKQVWGGVAEMNGSGRNFLFFFFKSIQGKWENLVWNFILLLCL